MKKILFSLLALGLGVFGVQAQELTTFSGYHTQLYGYRDVRYVERDKGDYLKTLAWYSGAEFLQNGFTTDSTESSHIVLGGGLLLYVQSGFSEKTLYAVNGNGRRFREQTVPTNPDDRAAQFQVSGSAFGGYTDYWWGGEGGLSVFIKGFEEKVRKKYNRVGVEVDAGGRGWVFGNGSLILPNFRFRVGAEQLPHFVLSLYRGHYDPGYGAFQARVVLPLLEVFSLTVGGSMVKTSSLFLEPTVRVGDLSSSIRVGTILNYNDSAFTRVGIFEGAFVSGSVGYHW